MTESVIAIYNRWFDHLLGADVAKAIVVDGNIAFIADDIDDLDIALAVIHKCAADEEKMAIASVQTIERSMMETPKLTPIVEPPKHDDMLKAMYDSGGELVIDW